MGWGRADRWACVAIGLAVVAVTWPLLANLHGMPPDDDDLDIDLLTYYGYCSAARQTLLRFGQFPWRSPWHGGGYPLYAYPDDLTLTPTMPLVLAIGPWAAIKIDFIVTSIVAGLGMFLLTRRKMGYSLVAALFSATAFSLGGFLMARWLRGWRVPTHAVWLPLILYALWRGRRRRWWLALAAVLVAWLLIDQKYVAMVMGWFLLMVGLLRLDEEQPQGASNPDGKVHSATADQSLGVPDTLTGPAWGWFGRLAAVWGFGAGLAAVKLVPLAPLLKEHLRAIGAVPAGADLWRAVAVWSVIFAALGLTPLVGRLVSARRTRLRGTGLIVLVAAAVVAAAWAWAPPPPSDQRPAHLLIEQRWDGFFSLGTWRTNQQGVTAPIHRDGYRFCAPVGPVVCVLAVGALVLRPRKTWKWAILAGLLVALELGEVLPRQVRESWHRLPMLSWIRRPREQLNFYLFFVLTLLAGRALDWRKSLQGKRLLRMAGWVLLAVNVVYVGREAHTRLAYTVATPLPPAPEWGAYELLNEPRHGWLQQPCFLLRGNVGLKAWNFDLHDARHEALAPSLLAASDGSSSANPDFEGMVSFREAGNVGQPPSAGPSRTGEPCAAKRFAGRGAAGACAAPNEAHLTDFTPNRIAVRVRVRRPGVLAINQIRDLDWRCDEGTLVRDGATLAVRLERIGIYEVHLRYVPVLFYVGLAASGAAAVSGCALLAGGRRRLTRKRAAV